MSRTEKLLLALILTAAAAVRLGALDTLPPPLNPDEASRGYDAWSLLQTGMDRHGERWPAFLKSFGPGDYTGAISAYLMIPSVAAFGPTPLGIRLPNAVLGAATVAALWWWVRRSFDVSTGLAAALLLAFCPWHLRLSRVGHEAGLVPFFITLGGALFTRALAPRVAIGAQADANPLGNRAGESSLSQVLCLAAAGICWGLAAWTYPAARLIVPVLSLMVVMVYWRAMLQVAKPRGAGVFAFVVGVIIGAMPVIWTAMRHPERIAARASATLVINDSTLTLPAQLAQVFRNGLSEISPDVLFIHGDDITAQRLNGYGRLLHVEMLFVLVGLTGILRALPAGHAPARRFLLLWLLLAIVPAAICKNWNPHPLRGIMAVPAWAIVSAIGVTASIAWCRRRLRAPLSNWAVAAVLGGIAVDAVVCTRAYFTTYATVAADHFQENIVRAVEWTRDHPDRFDRVLVSPFANQAYIYVLLYWPIPPREYHKLRESGMVDTIPWLESFDHVVRLGPFVFSRAFSPLVPLSVAAAKTVLEAIGQWPADARAIVIDVPGHGPPGPVIAAFARRQGGVGLEIREWKRTKE